MSLHQFYRVYINEFFEFADSNCELNRLKEIQLVPNASFRIVGQIMLDIRIKNVLFLPVY